MKNNFVQNKGNSFSTLFIGSVPTFVTENDLKKFFSYFGKILRAKIILDLETQKSKQCALLFCGSRKIAEKILFSGPHYIQDRLLRIDFAEESKKGTKCFTENTMFVGNIRLRTKDFQLQEYFERFGSVISVKVFSVSPISPTNNAIINFKENSAVIEIFKRPNSHKVDGRTLRCSRFQPKDKVGVKYKDQGSHLQGKQGNEGFEEHEYFSNSYNNYYPYTEEYYPEYQNNEGYNEFEDNFKNYEDEFYVDHPNQKNQNEEYRSNYYSGERCIDAGETVIRESNRGMNPTDRRYHESRDLTFPQQHRYLIPNTYHHLEAQYESDENNIRDTVDTICEPAFRLKSSGSSRGNVYNEMSDKVYSSNIFKTESSTHAESPYLIPAKKCPFDNEANRIESVGSKNHVQFNNSVFPLDLMSDEIFAKFYGIQGNTSNLERQSDTRSNVRNAQVYSFPNGN